jgi:hypothetical protein
VSGCESPVRGLTRKSAFGSGKFLVKSTRGAVICDMKGALGISRAKGLRVKNDDVSVAEILVREGWSHHVPPRSRSRWRVILVMVAVVLGCGTAAILVRIGHSADHQAQPLEQIGVIEMPQRTSGIAGADATPAPEQLNVPGGTGAGRRTTGPRTSGEQGTTTPRVSSPGHTSASTSGTTTPRVTPSTTGRSSPGTTSTTPSNSPSSSPPPPPTPTTSPCFLFFC